MSGEVVPLPTRKIVPLMSKEMSNKFPAFPERRVLVVEDDPLLGLHVRATPHEHGCLVIGPLRTVAPAVKVISADPGLV
jgi:hypothetical protein